MNSMDERKSFSQNNDILHDAETEFHVVFVWLATVSVSIAAASLTIIT